MIATLDLKATTWVAASGPRSNASLERQDALRLLRRRAHEGEPDAVHLVPLEPRSATAVADALNSPTELQPLRARSEDEGFEKVATWKRRERGEPS